MFLKNSNLPKPVKFILLTLILIAVYLIIAIPFKVISIIPGFTDIRPVMLFKPVFGVFFGIPGCFAFAIGNLIGDIMSDSLRWSSIAGFAANFLAPFVFYLFFVKFAGVTRATVHFFKHSFCFSAKLNCFRRKRTIFCTLLLADFFVSLSVLYVNMAEFVVFKKLRIGMLKRTDEISFFFFSFKRRFCL